MSKRSAAARWTLWVFAAALLLQAAMPWRASAAAQRRGQALAEVCTVYGVARVAPGGDAPAPLTDGHHGGPTCALLGLATLAFGDAPPLAVAALPPFAEAAPRIAVDHCGGDACARWAARLEHGPPALA